MSLLEQDITKKLQVDKKVEKLDADNNSEKYKIKVIWDRAIYAKKLKSHLLDLYYLVIWKRYLEKENT